MTHWEIFLLFGSALAAGAINAVAGGGTVLTFPALLYTGTGAVVANATSGLALMLGTAGSLFSFRSQLPSLKPWLLRFIPVSIAGSLLGSALVKLQGEAVFVKVVPWLILFATVLFLIQAPLKRWQQRRAETAGSAAPLPLAMGACIALQAGVALYGGYFGAGIGILMLAVLGLMGLSDIHRMNALKNLLAAVINATASVYFILSGLIDWPRAGIMIVGALIGYWLGAHYSQKIPQPAVRGVVIAVGLCISAAMFYKLWH
jgi:uncharacterized protein